MVQQRQTLSPTVEAFMAVLNTVMLGGKEAPADYDQAPDCSPPYFIVTTVSEVVDGTMESPEADSITRLQVIAVGDDGVIAMKLLDKSRAALTREAMNTHLTDRKVMLMTLDVMRGTDREERGLPEPLISKIDQYRIYTTPATI